MKIEEIEAAFGGLPEGLIRFYEDSLKFGSVVPGVCRQGQVSTVIDEWIPRSTVNSFLVNLNGNMDEGLIPIAKCFAGDYFVIKPPGNSVLFWCHEDASLEDVGCVSDFLNSVIPVNETYEGLEQIFSNDDLETLKDLLRDGAIRLDWKDVEGCGLFEKAAVYWAVNISNYLFDQGVDPKEALQLAEENLVLFPESLGYVKRIRKMVGDR